MAVFERPLSQAVFCWRIERRDGGGVAATSHDEALVIDGVVYDPHPGISPFAAHYASGLDGDDGEIGGALESRGLTKEDLSLGRWDDAHVRLFAVNWDAPEEGQIEFTTGRLGELRSQDGAFEAALVGPKAMLDTPFCPQTQPTCRAALGDKQCGVSMAGRSATLRAVVSDTGGLQVDQAVDSAFRFGSLTFLDGDNRGQRTAILSIEGDQLMLRDMPRGQIAAGERVHIEEGCDKLFATCRDRFQNYRNFRGEPHLPGRDLLTRYPGA